MHRDDKVAGEKIGEQVPERRLATELGGRNPSGRFTPFPTGGGSSVEPFAQVLGGHGISVDAFRTDKSFQWLLQNQAEIHRRIALSFRMDYKDISENSLVNRGLRAVMTLVMQRLCFTALYFASICIVVELR